MAGPPVPMERLDELFPTRTAKRRRDVYPEQILQLSEHGVRYNACFQRFLRQFVANPSDQMVRWRGSAIERVLSSITGMWSESDRGVSKKKDEERATSRATTSLFTWATDKTEKKVVGQPANTGAGEFKNKTSLNTSVIESEKERDEIVPLGASSPVTPRPRSSPQVHTAESLSNKLSRIVELESNKFIRARLQEISLHHSEQMSLQISERKRRDHERHLERLKAKEEQYNRELELAMKDKKGGFFSIFNFGALEPSKSEVFDTSDTLFDTEEAFESNGRPETEPNDNDPPRTPQREDSAADTTSEEFDDFAASPPPLSLAVLSPTTVGIKNNEVSLLDL